MQSFSSEYMIKSFTIAESKAAKPYARIQIQDTANGDVFNCVMWQEKLDSTDKTHLKVGNIIKIVEGDYNDRYKSLTLNKIELVKETKSGLDEEEREILFKYILEKSEAIKDENLKGSVLALIFENEEAFKISPAAVTMHHNYIGGLLQHITECISFAEASLSVCHQKIDRDLVLAGCITHDIAKIFEYKLDIETGSIEKDKEFQAAWINHIQWGFCWANNNKLPELAHIIASHHGLKEWNALVEPRTNEAKLVHHADLASSELGAINSSDLENVKIKQD